MPQIPTNDFDLTVRIRAIDLEDAIERLKTGSFQYEKYAVVAVNPAKWGA